MLINKVFVLLRFLNLYDIKKLLGCLIMCVCFDSSQ